MAQSFGARLRQQREERGIDLIAIAEQTKIKRSLLEALERDDVSVWPGGIFRRAFIRAYALAIGLDPDPVVREFLDLYPDSNDIAAEAVAAMAGVDDTPRKHGSPPTRLSYLMGSALSSLSRFAETVREARAEGLQPRDVPPIRPAADVPPPPEPPKASPVPEMRDLPVVPDIPEIPVVPVIPVLPEASQVREREPVQRTEPQRVSEPPPIIPEQAIAQPPAAPEPVVVPLPQEERPRVEAEPVLDLLAVADLITELGRTDDRYGAHTVLREAAAMLDAAGAIVWIWEEVANQLTPTYVQGYSAKVLAQLPTVGRDADNATAAAFRSEEACAVPGAIVVPLLTTAGCCGVLAIELREPAMPAKPARAIAAMLAAGFAQLVLRTRSGLARPETDTVLAGAARFGRVQRPMKVRR